MHSRFGLAVLLATLTVSLMRGATAAQDATPALPSGRPPDLAAMALAPGDVPPGYFDDYFELWVPGDQVSELVLSGAAAPPGLVRSYQSFSFNPEEGTGIHNFLFEFASPDAAAAGSGIVDAALRPPLPEGDTIGPAHSPGPAVGEEPRATTAVTYDTWAAGGPRVDTVAVSFRRDRLVVGVSVDRFTDPPPPGTPAAAVATPAAPDSAQEQLAADLAAALDGRITAVLAGNAPAGVDLALPDLVLPLDQVTAGGTPVLGGYKAGIDLLRCGICGEENTLLPFAGAARGGFARGVALGPLVDGEPQPPFVSVAVSAFATPQDALDVLAAIRQAPNERPTPGPVPRGERTLAEDPVVPGADAALAFEATFNPEDPNAQVDSAGVDFVVGAWLVTVDVQGGLAAAEAMAAAVDLATQQAACLATSDPCEAVTLPPSLRSAVDDS